MNLNKKLAAILVVFCLVILGSIVYFGRTRFQASKNIPNAEDSRKIQEVIHHSYNVFREALRNGGDVSEFHTVFTNTSDYSYENGDVRAFVSLVLGVEEAAKGGYLTVMQAKYEAYGCAIRLLKETEKLAKKATRDVTSEEIKLIQGKCYGVLPPSLSVDAPPKVEFQNIEIVGDRAIVRYDDSAALLEATLVRVNGRWLIANIIPIEIHY